jgi:hypothetical protein
MVPTERLRFAEVLAPLSYVTDLGMGEPDGQALRSTMSLTDGGAEAIEGSTVLGGIWAHERYDWTRPGVVRAEVADSNVFAVGSSWELHVEPDDGGSTVEWVSIRHPRGLRGRILVALLAVAGRRMLREALAETLRRLEAADTPVSEV